MKEITPKEAVFLERFIMKNNKTSYLIVKKEESTFDVFSEDSGRFMTTWNKIDFLNIPFFKFFLIKKTNKSNY